MVTLDAGTCSASGLGPGVSLRGFCLENFCSGVERSGMMQARAEALVETIQRDRRSSMTG
eukprot:2837995-Rhodomonas_salina.1